ncbi:MAG: phospholipase D-like domain-containing protein, partial [Dehalococcoidia bacterium]|nr:phospholipase D-like domain-containing protein [Dehalococcoidia bacterium]
MNETSYTLTGLRGVPWRASYASSDSPLDSFYIPALERSVGYYRIAGFFSSAALSVAATGIASMISRGGRMRLLVGAELSEDDVNAILKGIRLQDVLAQKFQGILTDPQALADLLARRRLEALAWLAANDRLDIRVCVEADPQTAAPMASGGYFHAKGGILRDEYGDAVVFTGSINETSTAWRNNYEHFSVYTSWEDAKFFDPEVERFERLWTDAEPGWRTVDLPTAVRDELVDLAPPETPRPLTPAEEEESASTDNASWIARFVRDAPHLVGNGSHVGVETAAVDPFPHQRAVAYDILDRFSCNHLLADEVGLGKTIEAGLILRSLMISKRVSRCLILVPRSLAKQWQEELRDRFQIEAPFYDGRQYVWFGQPRDSYQDIPNGLSPWEGSSVIIASAQMVKRQD